MWCAVARVVLVDDDDAVRGALKDGLAGPDVEIVGEARDGFEAVDIVLQRYGRPTVAELPLDV